MFFFIIIDEELLTSQTVQETATNGANTSTGKTSKMKCTDFEFQCDIYRCIKSSWKCDGAKDCKDGADEKDCVFETVNVICA